MADSVHKPAITPAVQEILDTEDSDKRRKLIHGLSVSDKVVASFYLRGNDNLELRSVFDGYRNPEFREWQRRNSGLYPYATDGNIPPKSPGPPSISKIDIKLPITPSVQDVLDTADPVKRHQLIWDLGLPDKVVAWTHLRDRDDRIELRNSLGADYDEWRLRVRLNDPHLKPMKSGRPSRKSRRGRGRGRGRGTRRTKTSKKRHTRSKRSSR
jgi:hypothetical protein